MENPIVDGKINIAIPDCNSSINFRGMQIIGNIYGIGAKISQNLDLRNSMIGSLTLEEAEIGGKPDEFATIYAHFDGAFIKECLSVKRSLIPYVSAKGLEVGKSIIIHDNDVEEYNFSGTHARNLNFGLKNINNKSRDNSIILSGSSFQKVNICNNYDVGFSENINCSYIKVTENVELENIVIDGVLDFHAAEISNDLSLKCLKAKRVYWERGICIGILDLRGTKIESQYGFDDFSIGTGQYRIDANTLIPNEMMQILKFRYQQLE